MFELVITKFRPTEVLRSRITHSRPASGLNPFPPPASLPARLDCSLPLNILNIGNIESIART